MAKKPWLTERQFVMLIGSALVGIIFVFVWTLWTLIHRMS